MATKVFEFDLWAARDDDDNSLWIYLSEPKKENDGYYIANEESSYTLINGFLQDTITQFQQDNITQFQEELNLTNVK